MNGVQCVATVSEVEGSETATMRGHSGDRVEESHRGLGAATLESTHHYLSSVVTPFSFPRVLRPQLPLGLLINSTYYTVLHSLEPQAMIVDREMGVWLTVVFF